MPPTFELCEDIIAPGGTIANVGVHGTKVDLHLERLWSHNITITTGLVDTLSIPMLLKTVQSNGIDAARLITHRFKLDDILQAYETFSRAADTQALKVIIEAWGPSSGRIPTCNAGNPRRGAQTAEAIFEGSAATRTAMRGRCISPTFPGAFHAHQTHTLTSHLRPGTCRAGRAGVVRRARRVGAEQHRTRCTRHQQYR